MSETCPSCGNQSGSLIAIDTGKKIALNLSYDRVCHNCYEKLPQQVSQGFKLRKQEEAKHENKVKLWKSRTELVKQGRNFFKHKAYSEAAMCYEKYLKVLEITHDVNDLTPELFSKSARSKELTIIATVYWDLLRAYDSHEKYRDRMEAASRKLSQFAPYSPIFPELVKRAENFSRNAKNPAPIKAFLKSANLRRSGCFIATAAFNTGFAPEVKALRLFRDQKLSKCLLGRAFIRLYYKLSPPMARLINRYEFLKPIVRLPLRVIVKLVK